MSLGKRALVQYLGFPKEMTNLRDLPTQTSARRYFLPTQLKNTGDETVTVQEGKQNQVEGFTRYFAGALELSGMLLSAARYYCSA